MSWAAETLSSRGTLYEATQKIADSTGIIVPKYRMPVVQAELERIGEQEGLSGGLERFLASEAVQSRVIRAIAIPETYMFRHSGHFEILRNLVELRAAAGRATRVLCAGCSTGEEVWSCAAVLASVPAPPVTQHEVVGWDLCPERLQYAREGHYTSWACRKGFSQYGRFFEELHPGFRVVGDLHELVRFAVVNLVADEFAEKPFNAILFRNVSIYWNENTINAVLEKLTPLIAQSGLLFVGPSDPVALPKAEWQHLISYNARCYQRTHKQPQSIHAQKAAPIRHVKKPKRVQNDPPPLPAPRSVRPQPSIEAVEAIRSEEKPALAPETESPLNKIRKLADVGHYQEALDCLHAVAEERDAPELKLWRGIILLALDRAEEALRVFRQCVFLQPENAENRQWLAVAYESVGRSIEAEREFRNASELGQ
jgi:chemotaxis protein methyltransferase CheR